MSNEQFTPLYYFMNENIAVVEVSNDTLPADATKQERLHWLKITNNCNTVERLTFKAMKSELVNGNEINVRSFEDGELRFDKNFAKFLYKGDGHIIMNIPVADISPETKNKISIYISSL